MQAWLAAALVSVNHLVVCALRKRLREKKTARVIVTVLGVILTVLLMGYLILTAIFVNAAYHH